MILGCSIVAVIAPLLLGAFACLLATKESTSELVPAWFSGVAVAASLLMILAIGPHAPFAFEERFVVTDSLTLCISSLILVLTMCVIILGSGTLARQGVDMPSEYYALLLLATAGAIVFISASHFLSVFMGLEILSLALYPLCAASIHRPRSAEGAVKYFILGATSSAIFMFGVALLFGITGSLSLLDIHLALVTVNSQVALFGVGLVIVGIAFKLALVPFHAWSPDAYLGAPLSIATYMATVVKTAAVVVAVRVIWFGFEHTVAFWSNALVIMAAASIVLGNIMSLAQTRFRRLMAYSGISHAGFMIIGLLAKLGESSSVGAVIFYAITYPLLTLGFFAVLHTMLREENASDDSFETVRGLFYRSPWLASLASFFLFGLAGLPPALIGFLSKWYVLQVAWSADYQWLVWVGVISSVVGAAYYLRPITLMFQKSEADEKKAALELKAAAGKDVSQKDIETEASDATFFVSQQRIIATIILLISLWISFFPSGLSYTSDQIMQELNQSGAAKTVTAEN